MHTTDQELNIRMNANCLSWQALNGEADNFYCAKGHQVSTLQLTHIPRFVGMLTNKNINFDTSDGNQADSSFRLITDGHNNPTPRTVGNGATDRNNDDLPDDGTEQVALTEFDRSEAEFKQANQWGGTWINSD